MLYATYRPEEGRDQQEKQAFRPAPLVGRMERPPGGRCGTAPAGPGAMKPFRLLPTYLLVGISVSVLVAGASAAITYAVYSHAADDLVTAGLAANDAAVQEHVRIHTEELTAGLASDIAPLVASADLDAAAKLLESSMRRSGAVRIEVAAPDGRVLLQVDEVAGRQLPAPGPLTATAPLVYNGIEIGTVSQAFAASDLGLGSALRGKLAEIVAAARRDVMQRLLLFGLLTVALVTGLAMTIAYRQIRVIGRLAEGAKALAAGDYDAALPPGDQDEFGELAVAFANMRERLRETTISRDYLNRVLGSMHEAIILTSDSGEIVRVNRAAAELLEYPEDELEGRPITDIVAPPARSSFAPADYQSQPTETIFLTRSGRQVPVSYTRSWVGADGPDARGWVVAARNISERKLAEQRIRFLARIDALTKIPNRMQFQHLLQRAIAKARRTERAIALMYLDVDRFKDINDTFGHMTGDTCLETLAQRVSKLLPDGAFMGRMAGDEFGIVLEQEGPAAGHAAHVQSLARSILQSIAELLLVQGHEIYMSASIGVARFPVDADNVLDLIRNADAAMYFAKRSGGQRMEFYSPDMNAEAVERLMLKSKLKRSYELDELLLNYQPKIDLRSGAIAGAEALVRWELSEHGLVLPSQFIPLAEETNLIIEIGEWVLNRVCADYASWRQQGADPGRVSVNLSLKQLTQPNFSRRINRIFRRHGITPDCLELEITETTLMQDVPRTIQILRELHRMGLHLAIDDFGTGYSSLSALQQFPIGTLKIDQSFVRDAPTDPDDATIVSTIIEMAHSLKMEVIAEGVESEDQLGFLRTLNCDYVQGMLFGKPMPADGFLALIRSQGHGGLAYRSLFG
jgi:diguanylate cyclase (GGDEF)-like protein/PAS domain S-box-containing protein